MSWFTKRTGAPRRNRTKVVKPGLEILEERCLLTAGMLDPTFGNGGLVTTEFFFDPPLIAPGPPRTLRPPTHVCGFA